MTPFAVKRITQQSRDEYAAVVDYCKSADMRLSRDPVDGYWLHFDGHMRFIRYLNDVRGWVDYIEQRN